MKLWKSKTFWAAIVQFIIAVVAYILGTIDLKLLLADAGAMLMIIFFRESIDQNLRAWLNKFKWYRSKTIWTAIAAMLGFVIAYLTGQIELMAMIMAIVSAFIGIFLRSAISPEIV